MSQLLKGDENFPIIQELRWGLSMDEVRTLCAQRQVSITSTDSAMFVTVPILGFASRTELHFSEHPKTLNRVQARLNQPTKGAADSITNYLSRKFGANPFRTVKEKSVLIITLRMEIASWRLADGLVNVVTAMRGDSIFDASLVLIPPTTPQKPQSPQ